MTGIVKIWLGWNPVIEGTEKQRSPGVGIILKRHRNPNSQQEGEKIDY